jgi:hypothetical protein
MRTRILAEDHKDFGHDRHRLLLTTGDVARMLDLSANGVRWLAREGRLPFETTTAGHRIYRGSDVDVFAKQRMRARLRRVAARPRIAGSREPRQLPLFGVTLQIVGGHEKAKQALLDPTAKGSGLLKERDWV